MEKALEILNNTYYDDRGVLCVENTTALDLFNAIKELEEAQLTRREWYQKGYNEAMTPKTCEDCKGFVRNDYCHIIDDDCRVVMERCNGCKQFEPMSLDLDIFCTDVRGK